MKEGHSDSQPHDAFTRERLFSWGIVVSALLALGAMGYSLSVGVSIITSHLFYVPIVLAAYRYPDRGVAFAGALAVAYLAEVLLLAPESGLEVVNALFRAGVFVVVAAVVSHLSGRLRARESRYRGIFETSGAGIFLFSPETGKIEEMNRRCSAILGYPDDEAPSLEVSAIWPGYSGLAGALGERGIQGLDCNLVGREGEPCPVLLSANLLPGRQEGCVVVTGTAEQKEMEMDLRRLEETFRVILNTTDVGILLTAPGLQVMEANTAAIRLFGGAGPEDLIGQNPGDLIAESDREVIRNYRERVLHGERPAPRECMFRRLDGVEWPAEVSLTRLKRNGDAPERLVVSLRDITERRQAEEAMREEYRYLMVVNEIIAAATASRGLDDLLQVSLAKIVALLKFDLGAVYLMRSGSDAAVLRAREGAGWTPPATVRRDDPLYQKNSVTVSGVCCVDDFQGRYPHSGIRVFAVVPILGDDGPVGWIAVGNRVREAIPECERRILLGIAEELRNAVVKGMLQEDLEAALASANGYLEEATAAAAEVNLYVDILTHDINNANTVAMGYLQMYLESPSGSDGVLVGKSLTAVYQSSEIIRNILTLRKLKTGPAELGPVQLEPVIREVRNYHPDLNIASNGPDATVLADDLISEVFANLVGNALKFGGPGVEVTISVREEEDTVLVTVADNGPGIPDDLKPRVFERNQRGATKKSGKGLGLYIVRMLVERYMGSVRAGDRVPGHPEEGAAVTLTLPRYRPPVE